MVDNPLAKARGLSLHTGAQTMLYLSHKSCSDAEVHEYIFRRWEYLFNFISNSLQAGRANLFLEELTQDLEGLFSREINGKQQQLSAFAKMAGKRRCPHTL